MIIEMAKYFPLSHITLAEGGLDSIIAMKEKNYPILYIVDTYIIAMLWIKFNPS